MMKIVGIVFYSLNPTKMVKKIVVTNHIGFDIGF